MQPIGATKIATLTSQNTRQGSTRHNGAGQHNGAARAKAEARPLPNEGSFNVAIDLDKYTETAWIKAEMLEEGERLVLTISNIFEYAFPSGDEGLVLEFVEEEKRLALNKTRVRKLREMLGGNTDEWMGQQISLYPIDVQMNGKPVGSVAVGPVPKRKLKPATDNPDVLFGKE